MLGVSTYIQELSESYLIEASKNGVSYVFTSLHIPEEDYSNLKAKMDKFIAICTENNLQMVPDISPRTFEMLNIPLGDYEQLKALGISCIRLDYGFDEISEVKKIAKYFKIIFNASTMTEKYLNELLEAGVEVKQLALMHNFYPRENTGLSEAEFIRKNKVFDAYEIPIQAFICGDEIKRFPLFTGLPTLEKHREKHPYIAAIELIYLHGVSDIFIGDSQAKITTLSAINDYMNTNVIYLPAHLQAGYENLYNQKIGTRNDSSEDVVRLLKPRIDIVPKTIT